MIKVTQVQVLEDFKLNVRFSDGTHGVLDCAPIVAEDGPMLEPLQDPVYFARVFLDCGAPTWPNGYDMAPWTVQKELADAGQLVAAPGSNQSAAE